MNKSYRPTKNQLERSYKAYLKQYNTRASKNPYIYEKRLTKQQYRNAMIAAHNAGIDQNVARTIATKQRIWTYKFERSFYKETGMRVTGKEARSYKALAEATGIDTFDVTNKYEYDTATDNIEALTKQTVFEYWYEMRKAEDPDLSHDEIEEEFRAMY